MTDDRPVPPSLAPFWKSSLEQFATLPTPVLDAGQKERHRLCSLLLSALIYDKWNGNKYGELGDYGDWRKEEILGSDAAGQNIYRGGSYLGHNIAALAVDGDGRIMDFDFNHNDVFDSTVEHAESRLVRRLFALNQIYDPWAALAPEAASSKASQGFAGGRTSGYRRRTVFETAGSDRPAPLRRGTELLAAPTAQAPVPYGTLLKDVTIYTSLESCAQCSGIMCLASVKEIVYLQWDQGQYLIGNMMWRATRDQKTTTYGAPHPIRGDDFDFEYFTMLNDANEEFRSKIQSGTPFYTDLQGRTITSPSVTSFLCTDAARAIFGRASTELDNKSESDLAYPDWRPSQQPTALSNTELLAEIKDFRNWAQSFQKVNMLGSRGAPHRV